MGHARVSLLMWPRTASAIHPHGTSLLRIVGLKLDIEDALGVKVDLCTEAELHPDLRARILAEALPL